MSDKNAQHVLGVSISSTTIEAVLVREKDDYPEVIRRFTRPRVRADAAAAGDDFSNVLPGLKSSDDSDFTFEVGGTKGGAGSDFDFDELGNEPTGSGSGQKSSNGNGNGKGRIQPFTLQLREILEECKEIGIPDPKIAFCAGPPDTAAVEIVPELDESTVETGWRTEIRRLLPGGTDPETRRRIAAAEEAYGNPVDPERTIFLPMTPDESGAERHLAVFPTPKESVSPTLEALFAESEDVHATAGRFDAEISLYIRLVRNYVEPQAEQTTAVVRVGDEDTLLLFMTGNEVRHTEQLHSLTTYDSPETIGSRILLYQDDQKIGSVDQVMLVTERDDDRLLDILASYYPDATVERLTSMLTDSHLTASPSILQSLAAQSGPALGAALILLQDGTNSTNILPTSTRTKRRIAPVIAWHTTVVLLGLIGMSVFFSWKYVDQASTIERLQAQTQQNSISEPEVSPERLQQRVDSIQSAHQQYAHSLHVLDSLLTGSTEWSATIERTAKFTRMVANVWFEEWSIDPSTITLKGTALDRTNLADLARRLDGTVHTLSYAEINERRVYPFKIEIPRHTKLPEAAVRLRENFRTQEHANTVASASESTPSP